jgi:hypothetical protein
MYSQLPPLITQVDVYGQGNQSAGRVSSSSMANPGSAPSSTANQSNAPAISLIGLVLALVILRVAWEMGGEPGGG